MKKSKYKIRSKVWLYPGVAHSTSSGQAGAWHFLSVPKKETAKIKKDFGTLARGWNSLPVLANIRKTDWKTSIFYDKKSETYLLPLNLKIRKKEDIFADDIVTFSIEIKI